MKAVGIDIGTTTICAVVADEETGEMLEAVTRENQCDIPGEFQGAHLQDAEKICRICEKILNDIFDRYDGIRSLGVTGQMHGIVYLNRSGRSVSPLYTWQDRRGDKPYEDGTYASWLGRRSGRSVSTGFGAVTHFYNQVNRLIPPDAEVFCTIPDYVAMRLSGQKTPKIHGSMAASMGMYDGIERRFACEMIDNLGLGSSFFPEVYGEKVIGTWRGAAVCPALGDNQACFLGSVQGDADVLVNVGTGSQISLYSSEYFWASDIECRPYIGDGWILCGASLCGGYSYEIYKNFLCEVLDLCGYKADGDIYQTMNRMARQVYEKHRPENEKLNIDTTFNGTRTDRERTGRIENLTEDNFRPGDFSLGILEGICRELYDFYLKMPEKNRRIDRVVVSGNGMRKNAIMRNICRDMFGVDVRIPRYQEEASYGVALFSLLVEGRFKDRKEIQKLLCYEQADGGQLR